MPVGTKVTHEWFPGQVGVVVKNDYGYLTATFFDGARTVQCWVAGFNEVPA
jgi:hypothetical protein